MKLLQYTIIVISIAMINDMLTEIKDSTYSINSEKYKPKIKKSIHIEIGIVFSKKPAAYLISKLFCGQSC